MATAIALSHLPHCFVTLDEQIIFSFDLIMLFFFFNILIISFPIRYVSYTGVYTLVLIRLQGSKMAKG